MASCTFGWDLLYNSVKDDIKSNEDVLVCLAHFVLVTNDFKCIGLGESKELTGEEKKSESLPKKWNEHYAIRYVRQGRLYNLQATLVDDKVLINLHRIDENNVSLVQLNTDSVAKRTGTIEEMIPEHKRLIDVIKAQLVDKLVVSEKSKDCSSQTDALPTSERRRPEPISPLLEPRPGNIFDPGFGPGPRFDPLGVGQSDLHPFGGRIGIGPMPPGGGGMLFRPPGSSSSFPNGGGHPGGVAPGSVPPGARFDPFRPPAGPRAPRRQFPPDSDEFPPPDFDHYS